MEIGIQRQFVQKIIAVARQPEARQQIANPAWREVEAALGQLATGTFVRVELLNEDETSSMTIYGEGGAYFIVISVKESLYHYFSNGQQPTGQLRAIGGNLFDTDKVCENLETVIQIANEFWLSGRCLESVKWISEQIES